MPQYFFCFVLFCISACWTASDIPCGGRNRHHHHRSLCDNSVRDACLSTLRQLLTCKLQCTSVSALSGWRQQA